MIVGTTETAKILNISTGRLKEGPLLVGAIPASQLKPWFMLIAKGLDKIKKTFLNSQ